MGVIQNCDLEFVVGFMWIRTPRVKPQGAPISSVGYARVRLGGKAGISQK